jgi:citrate lyase subunit beta/citryl-CoA lyase
LRRSQLYVPGNNAKMIAKSATLDSDSVILDLEDAVPDAQKAEARSLVKRLTAEIDWGRKELCVRINPLGSRELAKDLAALSRLERIDVVVIPKAEGDCSSIGRATGKALIPIIETAKGLTHIEEVAGSKRVAALTFGAADYAHSVGGSVSAYLNNETVKTLLVATAKSHGAEAVDNVFFDLNDIEGFRREASAARSLGFTGKQVIHPSQIPVANEVFAPTKEELEWAQRVLAEFQSATRKNRGAIKIDGKLVDAVHYRLAKDLLERSGPR